MKISKLIKTWEFSLFILLIAEIIILGLINPIFLDIENLLYATLDFSHILLAALPLTLVIITAGIDISSVSVMGLASIVLGLSWVAGVPIILAIVAALLVGILAGLFNGVFTANTDVNPLVITLGSLFMFAGFAQGLPILLDKLNFKVAGSGGLAAYQYEGITGLPYSFTDIAATTIWLIPLPFIIVLIFAAILALLLHKTRFGRSLYYIGVNLDASGYSGIAVKKILILVYIISGFGAALAGVILTAYFTSARADLGSDALLAIITAVVLGGSDILGGKGTILGTLLAGLVLGYLQQGLLAIGISGDIIQVVIGAVLIASLAIRALMNAVSQRRQNQKTLLSKGGS